MTGWEQRNAVLAPSSGQASAAEIARLSAAGLMPRRDYVEVARALDDADVIDEDFMLNRASAAGRAVTRRVGLAQGVLYEAFVHGRQYSHILAWADRVGIPLALLYKLAGGRRDLNLLSIYLTQGKKAMLVRDARAHTHLQSIMYHSSVQMELAAQTLKVPRERMHHVGASVDDRFWSPIEVAVSDRLLSVGWEARDYPTLVTAMTGLPHEVDIAVGTLGLWSSTVERRAEDGSAGRKPSADQSHQAGLDNFRNTLTYPLYRDWIDSLGPAGPPPNLTIHHQLAPPALRELYARARLVVVPLHDVEFDAGVTAINEALAMGKPLIATRTRGQVDVIEDGVHGLYVDPGDPGALRKAVQYLLDNPEDAARMGRAGRALITQKYTLDSYVGRVAAIVRGG